MGACDYCHFGKRWVSLSVGGCQPCWADYRHERGVYFFAGLVLSNKAKRGWPSR